MDFPCTPGFELSGKRALVAGASLGIGLAAVVTLAARSGDKLRQIIDEMGAQGWQADLLELDVFDMDTTAPDCDAVSDLNIKGAYFLTQAVVQGLINISSQIAHVGGIDRAIYCATKHVVEGFSKAMAIEWGRAGIRVNTICPTFILTLLTQSTFDNPERAAWIMNKTKLDRSGKVEDIMGTVVLLAFEAAALITGTALMVDGGWTAD